MNSVRAVGFEREDAYRPDDRRSMTTGWFDARKRGGANALVYLANIPSKASGPSLHIHRFDQFYFVSQGELNVEVGLEEFKLRSGQPAVLPARVAHRQWNSASETERN